MLAWGAPRLRDLPWRRTRDPWLVLVSEVMLQQTRAQRVIPKWRSFCAAYPTPTACAAAPLGDVLRLWQGLGYPRRARNLHRAAVAIEAAHGGEVPSRSRGVCSHCRASGRTRPGRVLAFAYERDVGVVDTNIARVLARTRGRTALRRLRPATRRPLRAARARLGLEPDAHGPRRIRVSPDAAVRRLSVGCDRAPGIAPDGRTPTRPSDRRVSARGRRRIAGSDRQARGEVLRALTSGPAPRDAFRDRHRRLAAPRRPRRRGGRPDRTPRSSALVTKFGHHTWS